LFGAGGNPGGFFMSFQRLHLAVEADLPTSEKLILLLMANSANDETGECFPSQGYLAKRSGLHRVTVNKTIKSLQGKGFIEQIHQVTDADLQLNRQGGRRRSSRYVVFPELLREATEDCSATLQRTVASGYNRDITKETLLNKPKKRRKTNGTGRPRPSAAQRALDAEKRLMGTETGTQ
jgi:DNA-binding MarR family transcriptional regulator